MKKIITLAFTLLSATCLFAQDDDLDTRYQFVNAEGTVLANGSTVSVTTGEKNAYDAFQMPSGLYVKNIDGADDVYLRVNYNIQKIDNGDFQICFPSSCVTRSEAGEYQTSPGTLSSGETRDMQTEWLPIEAGACYVTLQLETVTKSAGFPVTYSHNTYGPTVTLTFAYDPTNVSAITGDESKVKQRYATDGRLLESATHGINIVKRDNGATNKLIVK